MNSQGQQAGGMKDAGSDVISCLVSYLVPWYHSEAVMCPRDSIMLQMLLSFGTEEGGFFSQAQLPPEPPTVCPAQVLESSAGKDH